MTPGRTRHGMRRALSSPAVASAFATAAAGAVFGQHLITSLMGVPGYGAVVSGLLLLGIAILVARRRDVAHSRFMPISLMLFLGWLLITVLWSSAPFTTLLSWFSFASLAVIATVVAHTRETLQIIRAVGDVLRVYLVASVIIEVFSGILIDTPIPFLGVAGNLAQGGSIQGVFGSRTRLGIVVVIALVTFLIEWRTRSVLPGWSIFSVTVALSLALFTRSPMILLLLVATGAAVGILALVRRTPARIRPRVQAGLAVLTAAVAMVVYLARGPIAARLNAEPEFSARSGLWRVVGQLVDLRPVQGWGWFGEWRSGDLPFSAIEVLLGRPRGSALNAYLDVLLQAGWVGVVFFAAFLAVALGRAWVGASDRVSTTYTWPALMLIAVFTASLFESTLLWDFGWFLAVTCATRVALGRGWRVGGEAPEGSALPHSTG